MKISQTGISLIKSFEGLRLRAYKDAVNVLTIGYGHTGPDVKEGMTITEQQAEDLLRRDLQRFEEAVTKAVTVPLNQNEFDALVSLSYNIGTNAFSNSTLVKILNKDQRLNAAQEFVKWARAGSSLLRGLVRRRLTEALVFTKSSKVVP